MPLQRWKTLRRVFEIRNPWWSYRKDEFIMEGGHTGEYHGVHSEGSSMVVPVEADGRVVMVNQFRYLNMKESLEFPCGSVKPGADHLSTAAAELAEEAGAAAESLSPAGAFNPCNGMTDEICQVYVARGLTPAHVEADPAEELERRKVTPAEVDSMIATGEIWDGMTLAAWALVRKSLAAVLLFCLTACLPACAQQEKEDQPAQERPPSAQTPLVKTGADVLLERRLDLLSGRRIGVICNHTSVVAGGKHLVDALLERGVTVTALFGPEHGIRGTAAAGKKVADTADAITGLPVYSLYGSTTKPTPEMLANVDLLLFDIQDIGARFYTYAGTMAFAMEAAAQNGKGFVVLDRPNPVNGVDVEGPVLDLEFRSLIGMFPVPIRHGLTLGELAKMILGEGWIDDTRLSLEVVPMEGWTRGMWFDQTGLAWSAPSPNMRTLATATVYPGTCLVEATNLSEGRGTEKPFEYIGAPGVNGDALARELNAGGLAGVRFRPIAFTPAAGEAAGPNPKHKDRPCGGIAVEVTDRSVFRPVLAGLTIMRAFEKASGGKFQLREGFADRLLGSDVVRKGYQEGRSPAELLALNAADFDLYMKSRAKYLLY